MGCCSIHECPVSKSTNCGSWLRTASGFVLQCESNTFPMIMHTSPIDGSRYLLSSLPTLSDAPDLTLIQETGSFYNFSNVRFAQPPTGDLRFFPPEEPVVDRTIVHNGSERRVCPQALPNWYVPQGSAVFEYLYGVNVSWTGPLSGPDPDESEDCLFLDVIVPKPVFDNAGTRKAAPVSINRSAVYSFNMLTSFRCWFGSMEVHTQLARSLEALVVR